MKKIISLCLALCMVCALSVSAFAAEIDTNGGTGSAQTVPFRGTDTSSDPD